MQEFEDDAGCKLDPECSSGVVVQPRQGKAILWFNHLIHENGTVGISDSRTFHGGCELASGTKWIANLWIPFSANEYYLPLEHVDDSAEGGDDQESPDFSTGDSDWDFMEPYNDDYDDDDDDDMDMDGGDDFNEDNPADPDGRYEDEKESSARPSDEL
ncbi:MAG: hypothetical protein AAF587_44830 [Bacteroidota bacterium]